MIKTKIGSILTASSLAFGSTFAAPAQAQDFYIGQIITFAGNFCPRGTASAEGQLLSISQNEALFSLIGTYYGGDGRTTFGLPDLRGRSVVNSGTGPGLTEQKVGQKMNFGTDTNIGTVGASLAVTMCIVTVGVYPSRS